MRPNRKFVQPSKDCSKGKSGNTLRQKGKNKCSVAGAVAAATQEGNRLPEKVTDRRDTESEYAIKDI